MKTCKACNGKVPENRTAPCPLCGKSMGFHIHRHNEDSIPIQDRVDWKGSFARIVEGKLRHLVFISPGISVLLAVFFTPALKLYIPFSILAPIMLGVFSFIVDDFRKSRAKIERVKISSTYG